MIYDTNKFEVSHKMMWDCQQILKKSTNYVSTLLFKRYCISPSTNDGLFLFLPFISKMLIKLVLLSETVVFWVENTTNLTTSKNSDEKSKPINPHEYKM